MVKVKTMLMKIREKQGIGCINRKRKQTTNVIGNEIVKGNGNNGLMRKNGYNDPQVMINGQPELQPGRMTLLMNLVYPELMRTVFGA
jgi:hypothetical protein